MNQKNLETQLKEALRRASVQIKSLLGEVEHLRQRGPIAVVGMGCRFPGGANRPAAFWNLLRDGVDAVDEVPPDRWDRDRWLDADGEAPGKMSTARGGFLDVPVDGFDAGFFNIAPVEARALDPQQRLLMEVVWEAIEDAGIRPESLRGSKTGTWVGISADDYARAHRHGDPERIDAYAITGTTFSTAAGRLAYLLGLEGPAVALDTACSSSLVALHLACRSLRAGETDCALVAGVNLMLAPELHVCFSKLQALSADGRCKTFDAAADGYVRGEGCGVVVLKPLDAALADGDRVLAVVRGTAVNQDGKSNGLTAPNGAAQRAVVRAALADGGLTPADIDYVEAHGTGTALGDPIEMEALASALLADRDPARPLLVGSVKTNIGHLEPAAGIAGLIKIVLAMGARKIPPHLHLTKPSAHIPWSQLPVRVPTALEPWPAADRPGCAGLSSFGFSGTNAHVVLSGPPVAAPAEEPGAEPKPASAELLVLSARSEEALRELARLNLERLSAESSPDWPAWCAATARQRDLYEHRVALVAESTAEAHKRLARFLDGEDHPETSRASCHGGGAAVAFLCTGQGSQYPGMAAALLASEPRFREAFERCAALLDPYLDRPLQALIAAETDCAALAATAHAQPAIFAVGYALAEWWRGLGVRPAVVLGHSLGEYVAACQAGVFSLEDAARLVAVRGRLMQELPAGGSMAVAFCEPARLHALCARASAPLTIASYNTPTSCTLSGEAETVKQVLEALSRDGVKTRALEVSHAFHSPLMVPMVDDFRRELLGVNMRLPRIPYISSTTGRLVTEELTNPEYWCRQITEPVRFVDALHCLAGDALPKAELLLEVGASPDLLAMARHLPQLAERGQVFSLRKHLDDRRAVRRALAELIAAGAAPHWRRLFERPGFRVALPPYPFQRRRYWLLDNHGAPPKPAPPVRASEDRPLSALLDHRLVSPFLEGVVFEADWHPRSRSLFEDHRVFGSYIVSGACMVSAALEAAATMHGEGPLRLEEVRFLRPLPVDDPEAGHIQLGVTTDTADQASRFRLFSLDGRRQDGAICHAEGRLARGPEDRIPGREAAVPDVSLFTRHEEGAFIYRAQAARSIDLGPSYRWLDELWLDRDRAVGRLVPPGDDALTDYLLHPGLIDSCFGLLVALADGDPRQTLVPTGIAELHLYRRPAAGPLWAQAQRRPSGPDQLLGDVRLVDDTGRVIALWKGLAGRAVGSDRFRTLVAGPDAGLVGRAGDGADWLYRVTWMKRALGGLGLPGSMPDLLHQWRLRVESQKADYAVDPAAVTRLDGLCRDLVVATLDDLGAPFEIDRFFRLSDLVEKLAVVPRYRSLLARMLTMLVEDGLLETAADGYRVLMVPRVDAFAPQCDLLAARYPALGCELALLNQVAPHLGAVLQGRRDPLAEVLFAPGRAEHVTRAYADSPAAVALHAHLALLLHKLIAALPRNRGLRVLEIGAGTGATTAAVLAELPPDCVHYTFTDISTAFFPAARERFAATPGFACARLDIEREPEDFGFEPASFDLVVAANVLHATADLEQSLARVRRLLAPGGMMLVLEGTAPVRWMDLTFGLTDGWWRFADARDRATGPMAPVATWETALARQGFEAVVSLPAVPGRPELAWHQMVLAACVPRRPIAARSEAARPNAPRWLVFADDVGFGHALVEALEQRGATCEMILPEGPRMDYSGLVTLDPEDGESFEHLIESFGTSAPIEGIVFLWGMDGNDMARWSREEPESVVRAGWCGALNLARALKRLPAAQVPRLTLVTHGAVRVGDEEPRGLAGAPLWGLAKTISAELPECGVRLIDVEPELDGPEEGLVGRLCDELLVPDREDQLALRRGGRYVARLTRARDALTEAGASFEARADRTYLVFGGLGDLGLAVARRLVEGGARHLVLVGRRTVSPSRATALEGLRSAGARVRVMQADICHARQVDALFAEVLGHMPPLAGVVFSAGVVDNASLPDQDRERFQRVLQPKLNGVWHVHRHLRRQPDCPLILFSSAASVLPAPGQANHAAANACLDAMAHYRAAEGLQTLSLNWGAWASIGAAARGGKGGMLRVKGVDSLAPEPALDLFLRLWHSEAVQLAVVPIDWPAYLAQQIAPPFLEGFHREEEPGVAEESLRDVLMELAPELRRKRLKTEVEQLLARVLGLDADQRIDPELGFFQMGMDSLTSVELRNRLQKRLGCALDSTVAFDFPTVQDLTAHMADRFAGSGVEAAEIAEVSAEEEASKAPATVEELNNMSESEAEALLLAELADLDL
ncbi:SDR family NAD(P)-dependent oxidoreductase [Sulfidibacter corallicola]|uniref:SDR family NAD(P)-dependent oxidoreductase n=1 Tax=Sulfidibacter corallicola TaxID=2818388 RepID=A0A8A4TS90_SULCO|nr:type I polyketide synthase [Sulfidibacter corallicola]QTD52257.1 SDR family NAD(P)-dependent oxidoreductase [Sulfidibacter corallicola]